MRRHASNGGTPTIAALGRSLELLEALLYDREARSVPEIASQIGIPRATAHRQVATFLREGYLRRLGNGTLVAGPSLLALARHLQPTHVLVAVAGPVLRRLAARLGCLAQLGTLDSDMVTYHFKAGEQAGQFFTRVSQQLEAYCTGLGKTMLAHLPAHERDAYLASGPFPALTAQTITSPDALRAELEHVRNQGFAIDREEIVQGIMCFAAPVRWGTPACLAAISVSTAAPSNNEDMWISSITQAAAEIEALMRADSLGFVDKD